MYNELLITVDELWLKGKNRGEYVRLLKNHIRSVSKLLLNGPLKIENKSQTLHVYSEVPYQKEHLEILRRVPGINKILPAHRLDHGDDIFDKILSKIKDAIKETDKQFTFKAETKRVDKKFQIGSMDFSREVGGRVLKNFPNAEVSMKSPDYIFDIRIYKECIFLVTEMYNGIGGLPVGSNGHLVTMLSGGFDSPVASFQMSKRGCKQTFAFFYSYPFVGEEVKEKIFKMMEVLSTYQNHCKLYIVPFGEIQRHIAKTAYQEYRTLLFRKYMVEISNRIGDKIGGDALLTGDCLGQVSSQTIRNISVIDHFAKRPIFRPLMGMNKREIINQSLEIGTHDISVIPHDDACVMFAPDKPVIKGDLDYVKDYDTKNIGELESLLDQALEQSEVFSYTAIGNRE